MVEVTQEDRILLTEIVRRLDRESYDKDALEHVRRMLATHRIAAERKGMMEAAGIAGTDRLPFERLPAGDDSSALLLATQRQRRWSAQAIRQRATAIETGADHDR